MPKLKKSATKTKKKTKVVTKAKKKMTAKKTVAKVKKKATKATKASKVKKTKKAKVSAVPKGYAAVSPYLIVSNCADSIEFYKKVFGAKELVRMDQGNGKISHAELKIGENKIMLSDECLETNARAPESVGGSPVSIHLYVKNVDAIFNKAIEAGATVKKPVENMYYGDRNGAFQDPHGHIWFVSSRVEDVTPREMKKRAAALIAEKNNNM